MGATCERFDPAHLEVTVREVRPHPAVWPRTWVVRVRHRPSGRIAESDPGYSVARGREQALERLKEQLKGAE